MPVLIFNSHCNHHFLRNPDSLPSLTLYVALFLSVTSSFTLPSVGFLFAILFMFSPPWIKYKPHYSQTSWNSVSAGQPTKLHGSSQLDLLAFEYADARCSTPLLLLVRVLRFWGIAHLWSVLQLVWIEMWAEMINWCWGRCLCSVFWVQDALWPGQKKQINKNTVTSKNYRGNNLLLNLVGFDK